MYIYIYMYMYIYIYIYIYVYPIQNLFKGCLDSMKALLYTRSPSQDSRLFGPRPWKI